MDLQIDGLSIAVISVFISIDIIFFVWCAIDFLKYRYIDIEEPPYIVVVIVSAIIVCILLALFINNALESFVS